MLQYLHAQNPAEGWDNFISGDSLHWSQMALSGHSQGGGHAAFIAGEHRVDRVNTFASPNDYSAFFNDVAFWVKAPNATSPLAYYGFANLYDDIVDASEQFLHWEKLRFLGDTVQIESTACPYNHSHQLYTTVDISGLSVNHSLMIRDNETPLDSAGNPVFEEVWKYLLGIPCGGVSVEEEFLVSGLKFRVFPNPAADAVRVVSYDNTLVRGHIEIYDFSGRLLWRQPMTLAEVEIDVSRFPKGVLFVKAWDDQKDQFHTMKLIHQ